MTPPRLRSDCLWKLVLLRTRRWNGLTLAALLVLSTHLSVGGGPATSLQARAQEDDSAGPRVPVAEDEIARGDPSRPWVSVIFNAGAGFTPGTAILDTLAEQRVRTTFFLMGWWAERQPELVARIAAEGHEIASHGHEIFDLTRASDADVVADLNRADAIISGITGRTTRPLWSPSAGYRDARVRRLAASIGFRPIYWTLDSGDWTTDATGPGVRGRVLGNASNGTIIVMHFDSPRTADTVAAELPAIIAGLREQGYRLVTVTELVTGTLTANAD